MCFNDGVSMLAFLIGLYFSLIFYERGLYLPGILLLTITLIQLAEYFGHIALNRNDKKFKKNVSIGIFFILILQPLVQRYGTYHYGNNNNINWFILISTIYIILAINYYIKYKNNEEFTIDYLDKKCSTICRIKWNMLSINTLHISIIALLYCYLLLNNQIDNHITGLIKLLLIISITYVVLIDKIVNIPGIYSAFGGIWCMVSISYGPLYFLSYK